MNYEQLKNSILQEAIEGRLVPQDPNDEPASVLLDRIHDEKAKLVKEKKIKKDKNESRIYRTEDGHWMERFTDKKRPDVCIDDEIPFDIPETWEWCRVNELGEIITGGTPSKLESAFYGKDFPFYKPTDLNQGINTINSSDGLSTLGYNHSRQLKANSILVTCIGATIGKTGLIKRDGSCNQQINAIVPNTKLLEPRYVYMVFISNFMQSDIKSNASSTTLPILNRSKFCQLLFPIPPLSEQHRIVEKLEQILPKVEEYGKAQERLDTLNAELPDKLKTSILQEAIEGRLVPQDPNDEPASVLLDRIHDEKAKLVKEKKIKKDKNDSRIYRSADGHWMERFTDKKRPDVCIDDEIPFDIPETWEWCRLPEICSLLSRGKSPKYLDSDRRFPVFAQKCNLKEGGISLEQARFLDPSTVNKWPREFHLRTGDVLVNSTGTGTVGRTRLFNESCLGDYPFVVPDSHVTVIRTFKQISSNYIYAVISTKWIQDFFEDNLKGATNQKELYIAVLINLLIPLPPLSEQHRIVEKLESILPMLDTFKKR
ncbi:MAG: restriction endonuclease subunit S [Prevotella sp.]|nr:restriction endonuclease subunit S [Prevotella sp.]MDY4625674.1 restriction endonuclease subunit S [Prevotella sp.]